jgi:hypothetical protein
LLLYRFRNVIVLKNECAELYPFTTFSGVCCNSSQSDGFVVKILKISPDNLHPNNTRWVKFFYRLIIDTTVFATAYEHGRFYTYGEQFHFNWLKLYWIIENHKSSRLHLVLLKSEQ